MARGAGEPGEQSSTFDERIAEVLARADDVLRVTEPTAAEGLANARAVVAQTRRAVPVLTAKMQAAVRTFEATTARVEAIIRASRRARAAPAGGKAESKTSPARANVDSAALLAAVDEEIQVYEASLASLQRLSEVERANEQEWEKRAMLAVIAESDSLAREALARRNERARLAEAYELEARTGEAVLAELKTMADTLRRDPGLLGGR